MLQEERRREHERPRHNQPEQDRGGEQLGTGGRVAHRKEQRRAARGDHAVQEAEAAQLAAVHERARECVRHVRAHHHLHRHEQAAHEGDAEAAQRGARQEEGAHPEGGGEQLQQVGERVRELEPHPAVSQCPAKGELVREPSKRHGDHGVEENGARRGECLWPAPSNQRRLAAVAATARALVLLLEGLADGEEDGDARHKDGGADERVPSHERIGVDATFGLAHAIERVDDGEADGKVVGGHGEGGEHGGGQDSIPERPARQVEAHCGRKCQPDDGGLAEAAGEERLQAHSLQPCGRYRLKDEEREDDLADEEAEALHVTLARTDKAELNAGEPKEDGREGGEERVEEA
mmetsp:Transcript_42715/g.134773  ORF Transcript_42715/g.134773 Transcript_42715/m.134773 type:complete len:349 (+) Transcript_42715:972-2018(+)